MIKKSSKEIKDSEDKLEIVDLSPDVKETQFSPSLNKLDYLQSEMSEAVQDDSEEEIKEEESPRSR